MEQHLCHNDFLTVFGLFWVCMIHFWVHLGSKILRWNDNSRKVSSSCLWSFLEIEGDTLVNGILAVAIMVFVVNRPTLENMQKAFRPWNDVLTFWFWLKVVIFQHPFSSCCDINHVRISLLPPKKYESLLQQKYFIVTFLFFSNFLAF